MNRTRVLVVIIAILALAGVAGYLVLSNKGSSVNNAQDQQAANQFYADRSGGTPIPQMQTANGSGGAPLVGTVQQVTGNQLTVSADNGPSVNVTLATTGTVERQDTAQLSDIHPGDMVTALGNQQGVTMTAQLVQVGGGDADSGGPMMIQLNVPSSADDSGGNQTYPQKNSDSGQGSLPSGGRPVHGKVTQVGSNQLTIQISVGSAITATLDGNTIIQKQTTIALSDIQSGDHVVVRGQQSGSNYQATSILALPAAAH